MTAKTLLLVDGSSYLYRAFHALPDLRNREGLPTGALYGVLNMLRRLEKDYPADYIACVFDPKGKTFREDWYPQYKAHRPPMPEDLAAQIPPLFAAIRALGWPLVIVDGVEADDVIGTLVTEGTRRGWKSLVSTGDKDMAQLVNERVTLVNTMSNETLDPAGVTAKFGVEPGRIIDYLTLVGDAVDNIPGVNKVGPKTAVKWLSAYGRLGDVMAHAGEIKGAVGENLRQALDWLPMASRLLTIKTDVALPFAPESLVKQPPDTAGLRDLFQRYDFRGWLSELNATGAPAAIASDPDAGKHREGYETLLEEGALLAWLKKIEGAPLTALDTETDSLAPLQARLAGLSLAVAPGEAAYLPLAHRYPGAPEQIPLATALRLLQPWLEDAARPKLLQNAKFDRHVFANHRIELRGVVHDTLLESYVLEAHQPHDLDSLAKRHTGLDVLSYDQVTGKGVGRIAFNQVDLDTATRYAAEDADVTLRVHQALWPQIEASDGLRYVYADIEMAVAPVLFRMERTGVLLNRDALARQSRELGEKMLELEQRAFQIAGRPFNLNSPKQIQEILFGEMRLPVIKKTPGGAPSTDEEVLETLAADYPLPRALLDYRGLAKLKSTYTDKLPAMINPATGRVHTSFSQATAVTGRLASADPNLQNIPARTAEGRRIREAFIAPPGHVIVSADYSQIELRIMAHLSDDPGLLKAFGADEDIHAATAAEVFGVPLSAVSAEQRRMAKVINFGLIYGMSAFGLASQLGLERAAAQAWIDRYFTRYPGVARYMENTREGARRRGYVETAFGRRLYLPEINSKNPQRRQGAERAAINAPMQGTAADLIKLAMVAVQNWLDQDGLRSRLILQVHDELVLEVPAAEQTPVLATLPRLMAGVASLKVPLKAGIGAGSNWEAAH